MLDDVHELAIVVVRVGHDQLVDVVSREHRGQRLEAAECGQAVVVGRSSPNGADEVVVDPAATLPERSVEAHEVLSLADQDRPAANAGQLEDVAGEDVVAPAQQADAECREHDRRRGEAVRREPMAGTEREDQRDRPDERERAHDPPEPGASLALGVEAGLPEDEHRDEQQERQPVRLGLPEDAPQDRALAVDEVPERQRRVDAEGQPDHVEQNERRDARRTARDGGQRVRCEEVGAT